MALIEKKERENFISILSSDASLRKVVPEDTQGAVRREYEDSKGNKGVKFEKIYESVSGKITDIKLVDTDFGTLLQISLTDTFLEDTEILSMSTAQSYGEDFMKKLPSLDLTKEVVIKPYKFTTEQGKELKGLSITQDGNKIENFFYDKEAKTTINGMPIPTGDTKKYSKDKWRIYFLEVRDFLTEYTRENFVSKFNKQLVEEQLDEEIETPEGF